MEGTESILQKRSVRLCSPILPVQLGNYKNWNTTAIERTIRNRNGWWAKAGCVLYPDSTQNIRKTGGFYHETWTYRTRKNGLEPGQKPD